MRNKYNNTTKTNTNTTNTEILDVLDRWDSVDVNGEIFKWLNGGPGVRCTALGVSGVKCDKVKQFYPIHRNVMKCRFKGPPPLGGGVQEGELSYYQWRANPCTAVEVKIIVQQC